MTMPGSHVMNRRDFLQTGAAALGLAALGTKPQVAPAADDKDPFGGFIIGLQSYTYRNFDLEPMLKRSQELGLHYAEFYSKHCPLTTNADQLKAFQKICKDY